MRSPAERIGQVNQWQVPKKARSGLLGQADRDQAQGDRLATFLLTRTVAFLAF